VSRFKKLSLRLGCSLLFTVFLFELGSLIVVRMGIIDAPLPAFRFRPRGELGGGSFWIDVDPHSGAWHGNNTSSHAKAACFDVTYLTNSYGARDRERELQSSKPRAVVLGDSFIEGVGVEAEDRLSDVLEAQTGREHLNFGCSTTGPTQYFLRYQHQAAPFSHEAVIFEVLPINDFDDDSLEYGRKFYYYRYKPYWVGEAPDYTLTYFVSSLDQSEHSTTKRQFSWKKFLVANALSFSHTANVALYMRQKLARGAAAQVTGKEKQEDVPSRFFTYTPAELGRLEKSLLELRKAAGDRPVLVLLIACREDLLAYDKDPRSPLGEALAPFCKEHRLELLDLLPLFAKAPDRDKLFLSCDGHWSPRGARFVADEVRRTFSWYSKTESR
jgi:hypothetical protein